MHFALAGDAFFNPHARELLEIAIRHPECLLDVMHERACLEGNAEEDELAAQAVKVSEGRIGGKGIIADAGYAFPMLAPGGDGKKRMFGTPDIGALAKVLVQSAHFRRRAIDVEDLAIAIAISKRREDDGPFGPDGRR